MKQVKTIEPSGLVRYEQETLSLLASKKQALLLESARRQGTEGGLLPTASKKPRLSAPQHARDWVLPTATRAWRQLLPWSSLR